jgi:hypothetical protein
VSKLAALLLALAVPAHAQHAYDLVVYGATAGGVTTAISGARHGLETVLIEPGRHVGGMSTGGLSRTDVGKREVIGGMALEFYQLVGDRYEMRRYNQPVAWFYEPKVGEAVMRQWLKDSGVTVLFGHRLEEKDGVVGDGARVLEIVTESGARFRGSVFATAPTKATSWLRRRSATRGREAVSEYGESLAGVRDRTPLHQFMVDDPPTTKAARPPKSRAASWRTRHGGSQHPGLQLPCHRDRRPANRIPGRSRTGTRPRGTRSWRGCSRRPWLRRAAPHLQRSGPDRATSQPQGRHQQQRRRLHRLHRQEPRVSRGLLPPAAGIWQEHVDYVQGFFYFLANETAVLASLQAEVREWACPETSSRTPRTGRTSSTCARRAAWSAST